MSDVARKRRFDPFGGGLHLKRRILLSRWSFKRKGWHPRAKKLARLRALYWTLIRGHYSEICNRCGHPVGVGWRTATDQLWLDGCGLANPPHGQLCPECFSDSAHEAGLRPISWECASPGWPSCGVHPCVHEATERIMYEHREELWLALIDATGGLEEAREFMRRREGSARGPSRETIARV